MEKMIGVINDNLKSVISGIKSHRIDTENELSRINKEIEEKASIAREYGISIDDSKTEISKYEEEIIELESDLNELSDKFKNFSELLAAGNKEINSKIQEKKSAINKERENIKQITTEAEKMKEEIVELESNKVKLEEELKKALILEKYYEARISSIIDYSVNHQEELDNYVVPEIKEELDVKDLEINETVLNHEIDDSVFEEIDHISDVDDLEEEFEEESEEETDESESVKDTLDKLISVGTSLSSSIPEYELEEDIPDVDSIEESDDGEVEKTILDDNLFDEEKETSYKLEEDEDTINLYIPDDVETETSLFNPEEFRDIEEKDELLNEMSSSIFDTFDNLDESLVELGLDKYRFDDEDMKKLENNFNKDNTVKFLNILDKHKLDKNLIYTSVEVLMNVTPQNLDHILTILEASNATSEDISCVFNLLDKVNINKLEEITSESKEDEIANLLYASMNYSNSCELMIKLGFTKEEEKRFKKNLNDEEFLIYNTFSDIVIKNFNTINSLNVDNARNCLIDHPHRFIFNPSRFNSILDKYDKEDLIRCINKNVAVIDRL